MLAIVSSYTVIATDISTGPAGVVYNTYIIMHITLTHALAILELVNQS